MKNKTTAFEKELRVSRQRTMKKFYKLLECVLVMNEKGQRCGFCVMWM